MSDGSTGPLFTLCVDSGEQAVAGACPTHRGDACLHQFVKMAWGDASDESPWMQVVNAVQLHPAWDEEIADGRGTFVDWGEGMEDEGLWCSRVCIDLADAEPAG